MLRIAEEIYLQVPKYIAYIQAVQNCVRCFQVVVLNLYGNRDSAMAGHHFSAKSI